jgi:hypothetical protein
VPAGTAFGLASVFPSAILKQKWIKIAVQEPALSLDEHRQSHGLVRLYSGDRLTLVTDFFNSIGQGRTVDPEPVVKMLGVGHPPLSAEWPTL